MTTLAAPWRVPPPLPAAELATVRRRAIFDCCKWDPQVEDVPTLAPFPLVLPAACWRELANLTSRLAAETLAAERELLDRPDLHRALAMPRSIRRALRGGAARSTRAEPPRLMRFDFHHTSDGWRISEANTDVPGGINEASGFAALMAARYPGTSTAGDVAGAYARAVVGAARGALPDSRATPPTIALVHATAYSDDQQVMAYLGRRIEECGGRVTLAAPSHVAWHDGGACLTIGPRGGTGDASVDLIVRFFPAEWLPELPRRTEWPMFFAGARTLQSNPATALLTQSKRLPLIWDELSTPLPTWRALLPTTVDPRAIRVGDEAWVVKPALGRVGEGVGIPGVTGDREWRRIRRDVRVHARHWVAQRRFAPTVVDTVDGPRYPCVGVYAVGTEAIGIYGRLARRPLIDWQAQDVAVLVADDAAAASPHHAAAWPDGDDPAVVGGPGRDVGRSMTLELANTVRHHRLVDRRRTG